MPIEVIYATPDAVDATSVAWQHGMTLRDAILRSGLCTRHPEIDLAQSAAGVWGRRRALEDSLADGDRVELYRALLADPKQARRQRVASARARRR